jgi:hypothetical protein
MDVVIGAQIALFQFIPLPTDIAIMQLKAYNIAK